MAGSKSSSTSSSVAPVPSPETSLSPSASGPTPEARATAAYERLARSSSELNAVSDELAVPIAQVEEGLKRLNLGIETWVNFAGDSDEYDRFWDRAIGYAKVTNKWGIAIRSRAGFIDGDFTTDFWLFSDAPRAYRLESVDKLPELLEALVTAAEDTASKLKTKVEVVSQVARGMLLTDAGLKEALLAEIKKAKVVFYNMVIAQAKSIALKGDRMTVSFSPQQAALANQLSQHRAWIETLAQRLTGRAIVVAIASVDAPAAVK